MLTVGSHNGLKATRHAYDRIQQGADALEAVVAGVTLVEDDEQELTVGYGGLPNEQGVVELDAAVMDGRQHRGAGVAALRGFRHPTRIAQRLLQLTNRVLLVGEGAAEFARDQGFPQENLLTDRARRMWMYWRRSRKDHDDWLTPQQPDDGEDLEVRSWFERHFYHPSGKAEGTVHCAGLDQHGDLACGTSTSGHAFKLAGRVGDSPVLGAGLYVDNEVGSCGSIGHGEANLENLSSFAAVELMRQGASPLDAGREVLQRIVAKTAPTNRDDQQRPRFNLQLFLLHRNGSHAGVSMWSGKQYAVCDENGNRLEDCVPLFQKG